MSADIRRVIWQTRQRILSSDFNDATSLQHRALIQAAAAIAGGDVTQYGVLQGLNVAIPGGSLSVSVAAGLAFRFGSAPTAYDSTIEWIELRSPQSVDLTSFVDGANPRWVCIEIADSEATEVSTVHDVFDPTTGTFSTSSLPRIVGSSPTLSVTAGTAAATPQLPAGTAGRIPLAYVYIPAAAATLTVGDVVHCRPVMRAPGNVDAFVGASLRRVQGGGIAVASDGTSLSLRGCVGTFDLHHTPFSVGVVGSTTTWTLSAAAMDGGSLPGADTALYLYALPAPYPAGYDASLAPREFRPEASAATRFGALVTAELSGCIVVASTKTPNTGTLQGAPTSGSFSITAAPWGGAASVVASRAVYLGAVHFDQGPNVVRAQGERAGLTYPTGVSGPVINLAVASSPASLWGVVGTDAFLFPATAGEVLGQVTLAVAPTQNATVSITDQTGQALLQEEDPPTNAVTRSTRQTILPNQLNGEIAFALSGTASAATLRGVAYRDTVLARR